MGELAKAVRRTMQKDPVTGNTYSGSSYQKTLSVGGLADQENFILYAESDGVHTDAPNVLSVRKTGTSIRASVLYYNDGQYMVKTEACQISGGTITANSNFRKSCKYSYIAW